jgi:hypothetical protein
MLKQISIAAALVGLLAAATLASADEPRAPDTQRVNGANDIYRLKIHDMSNADSAAAVREQSWQFTESGYYLYDLDAWAMVSSGPIIGPMRGRPYSLFGAGFDDPALNRWTMRSESLRRNAVNEPDPSAAWSHPEWRF